MLPENISVEKRTSKTWERGRPEKERNTDGTDASVNTTELLPFSSLSLSCESGVSSKSRASSESGDSSSDELYFKKLLFC